MVFQGSNTLQMQGCNSSMRRISKNDFNTHLARKTSSGSLLMLEAQVCQIHPLQTKIPEVQLLSPPGMTRRLLHERPCPSAPCHSITKGHLQDFSNILCSRNRGPEPLCLLHHPGFTKTLLLFHVCGLGF